MPPTVPACVGTFQAGDPQCDGGLSDPIPCVWRDKCGAFKTHIEARPSDGEKWLDPKSGELLADPDFFNSFCLDLVSELAVIDGRPQQEEEPEMPTLVQIAKDAGLSARCPKCLHIEPLGDSVPKLFEAVLERLAAGEPVVIRGFGTFERKKYKSRGLAKDAGDRWIIRFKAAPKAKQKLNQGDT